jgi:excisionase family DNA binding protein
MDTTTLLTAKDIANALNVSKSMVYCLISQGQIRSVRFNKTVRVRPQDLESFIQLNATEQELQQVFPKNPPKNSKKEHPL